MAQNKHSNFQVLPSWEWGRHGGLDPSPPAKPAQTSGGTNFSCQIISSLLDMHGSKQHSALPWSWGVWVYWEPCKHCGLTGVGQNWDGKSRKCCLIWGAKRREWWEREREKIDRWERRRKRGKKEDRGDKGKWRARDKDREERDNRTPNWNCDTSGNYVCSLQGVECMEYVVTCMELTDV